MEARTGYLVVALAAALATAWLAVQIIGPLVRLGLLIAAALVAVAAVRAWRTARDARDPDPRRRPGREAVPRR